jgi:hypothetical protein
VRFVEGERGPQVKVWYKDMAIVTGVVLLLLGIGNWVTGTIRLREHEVELAAGVGRTPEDASSSFAQRSDPAAEELELARARMDFYHVVASGGRLLSAAGLVLTSIGLARYLRPRARGNR